MAQDIGPRIGIQGEAEYRRSIKNITQETKTLKAEMLATTSAFDKNTSAQEKTSKISQVLSKQIEVQKQRLSEEKKHLENVAAARRNLIDQMHLATQAGNQDAEAFAKLERSLEAADLELERSKEKVSKATAEYNRLEQQLAALPSRTQLVGEAFQNVGGKIEAVGQKISTVGDKLTKTLTLPIAGGFAAATKASLSFEDGVAKVYTIADKSIKPISEMSDELLALSNRTGKGARELAEAAYQALSASVSTEEAVGFVSTAADLAKAGFLETSGAVDVLTTVINAYGMSAIDAQKIADQLIQTQNDGKTTVDQLAQSMGQIIPTAAALNVPLEQLNAAYALMTKQGINTANTTTYLNGLFTELSDSGSTVGTILQETTGKTFGQLQASGKSLGDILQILSTTVNGDSEAFLNLFGNVRAGRGALALLNAGVEEFNAETAKMQAAGGNVSAALEDLDTKGAKARRSINQLVNAGIEIGDRFAPYVEKAASYISELLAKWDALDPAAQNTIIKAAAITAAIGPVLSVVGKLTSGVGGLISFVGKAIGIAGPLIGAIAPVLPAVLAIGTAIGVVVAAGVALYKNWDTIKAKAVEFKDNLAVGWAATKEDAAAAWDGIKNTISGAWQSIEQKTGEYWSGIKQKVEENGGGIVGVIKTAVGEYLNIWKTGFNLLDQVTGGKLSEILDKIKTAVNKIKSLFSFNWELPKLKLPHFSWSWNDLGVIRLPKISVEYYKKAYNNPVMFKSPTVLQTPGGLKGFGDGNGGEVVIGRNMMYAMIRDAVQSGGASNTFNGDINVTVYGAEGQSNETLADMVAQRIYAEITQRRAAFG